ncbi:myb-like transcription factor family protein [Actinidia rufa]|uniref:Myb-like transcription factor family protein n=1 Tax=Actinidia rufa TaxID=165716 RepID=A0A7J0FT76_9ERIC|nr:myb-like transcription factor family protein [Actinidia rufa]
MGNLTHYTGSGSVTPQNGAVAADNHRDSPGDMPDHGGDGYASEDFVPGSSTSRERKKGVPWTEEEHRMFLLGLQKLGKVETPIASQDFFTVNPPQDETLTKNLLPPAPVLDEECESMDSTNSNDAEPVPQRPDSLQCCYPVVIPAYISLVLPFSVPLCPGHTTESAKAETHEVLKPTAVHSKSQINVDELVGMSKLSLGVESLANAGPSSLSLKLVEGSGRLSAFHANPASGNSRVNLSVNPIHAV